MEDPVLILLRDARSILDDGFCKYGFAVRENGAFCLPTDPRAIGHCAIGALCAAAGVETKSPHKVGKGRSNPVLDEAFSDLKAVMGAESIAAFNNRWFRGKRGVLRAFDRAIAFREKELAAGLVPVSLAAREPVATSIEK